MLGLQACAWNSIISIYGTVFYELHSNIFISLFKMEGLKESSMILESCWRAVGSGVAGTGLGWPVRYTRKSELKAENNSE